MLNVSGVSNNIFLNSHTVEMLPIVSAEWNQNLFNAPYLTVAGNGVKQALGTQTGSTVTDITSSMPYKNFTTKSFTLAYSSEDNVSSGSISYVVTPSNTAQSYKIVTYVKTNSPLPVMITSSTEYGTAAAEVNSFGWTKIETKIGSPNIITSFNYSITANTFDTDASAPNVYYTLPEVYVDTYFDYQHGSLWSTDSVFSYFRPGESYVQTGNQNFAFPSNYRKVNTQILANQSGAVNFPITPITQNPSHFVVAKPTPFYKNVLPSDMAAYKYFVSDPGVYVGSSQYNPAITGLYPSAINANKIVIKLNTIMSTPTLNVEIDGVIISVDGSQSITPDQHGLITLYATKTGNSTTWSTSKWSSMPHFNLDGSLSNYTQINKITLIQTTSTPKTEFSSTLSTSTDLSSDLNRMHVIEISPRLEIDLSDYVMEVDITKSLDSKNNSVPVSSINTDDASVLLSAIPLSNNNALIPLFSSQSNLSINVLSNMLRKNIKFYINFMVKSYFDPANNTNTPVNLLVPGGIYYSDTWDETDVKSVKVQCYDITRYLQTAPVSDYVANLKSVIEIITNLLDLAGFTDYDYDSLHSVCTDRKTPIGLSYYYCNSKDITVIDALSQIFIAYQIGAYMDEYGVMRFLSLSGVLGQNSSQMTIDDSTIIEGGYSITNKAKPGKISVRYQVPKIKQSLALQNATSDAIKNSPSFIYTTSNDVVWSQQTLDSVGFNYLNADMLKTENKFKLNVNDLLDIFHTFALNNNGYAVIEDEVVSFAYKGYILSDGTNTKNISVKNDLELQSEINLFTKTYENGLPLSDGTVKPSDNVTVTPTGYITNVQRGLFGTVANDHSIITSLNQKGLMESTLNSSYSESSGSTTSIFSSAVGDSNNLLTASSKSAIKKVQVTPLASTKTLIHPINNVDQNYKTYSTKFDMYDWDASSSGLFFNKPSNGAEGSYFVELVKFNQVDPKAKVAGTLYNPPKYRYLMVIYQIKNGSENVISWAEVTGTVYNIINNFEKILIKTTGSTYGYISSTDQCFNLKVTHYTSEDGDGEIPGEVIEVFLNNVEINGWQIQSGVLTKGELYSGWEATHKNAVTGVRQKVSINSSPLDCTGKYFGYFASTKPVSIVSYYYDTSTSTIKSSTIVTYPTVSSEIVGNFREIYACEKPLKERSVNYWHQDRQFLNGLVQGQNIYSIYKTYIVQTTPEVLGINYYDVQYTTPAAVSVDVLPIEYLWYYFPGTLPQDQQFYQKQLVDEYSLSYSTPINTGFRAKMAISNNSSHMVYLSKQSDSVNQFTVTLNLWTHEIIAQSDPEVIEKIIDQSNATEVIQLDSPWIQSKESAYSIMSAIENGIDGFSRDTSIQIFGNPLIQVGDIITINYSLAGLKQQKYLVHSVSHVFGQGLKTTLVLNMIDKGISY
jgi:hypothetical protein